MHTRYCPTCEDEFRPDIQRCSDCGGDLVDRYDDEDAPAPTDAAEAKAAAASEAGFIPAERAGVQGGAPVAPPRSTDDLRTVFTSLDAPSLKEAADRLHQAGLRFQATGSATGFRLLVRTPDAPAALAALVGLHGLEGMAGAGEESEPSMVMGAEGGACPACGAVIPAEALECPACGLVVGGEAGQCRGCGSPIGPDAAQCPACGAAAD